MSRRPAWKDLALKQAQEYIKVFEEKGYIVKKFTEYHWRISDVLDVWPSSKKCMFLDSDGDTVIGHYEEITELLKLLEKLKKDAENKDRN